MANSDPQLELQRMSFNGAHRPRTARSACIPGRMVALASAAAALALLPAAAHSQVPAQAIGGTGVTGAVVVGLAALAIAALIIIRTLRGGKKQRPQSDPFIVFAPMREKGGPAAGPRMPARPHPAETQRPAAMPAPAAPAPRAATPAEQPPFRFSDDGAGPFGTTAPAAGEPGKMIEGHTIRFHRMPEGTLRLLPGRLEVIEGADQGHEIRFVQAHPDMDSVTFGRREGAPYEHIQLLVGTVSREHARMQLREGHWWISNLSGTNPVAVNGQAVSSGNGGQQLSEGDRVEMGEVVFRFRER